MLSHLVEAAERGLKLQDGREENKEDMSLPLSVSVNGTSYEPLADETPAPTHKKENY